MYQSTEQKSSSNAVRRKPVAGSLLPILVLIMAAIAMVLLLVIYSAREMDVHQAQSTLKRAEPALTHVTNELGVNAKDYAWWDEAYQNLHLEISVEWAEYNISEGTLIGADRAIDGVILLSAENEFIYGMWQLIPLKESDIRKLKGGLIELADATRAQSVDGPTPASGYLAKENSIAFAAAAAVMPYEISLTQGAKPGKPVIIFLRSITPTYLQKFGSLYGFPEAKVSNWRSSEDSVVLKGADGTDVGYLSWKPERPGTKLLHSLLPKAALGLTVLSILGALVVNQLLSQRRTLRRQLQIIDEGSARLNETVDKLAATLESIDEGLAVCDGNKTLQHWNSAYEKLWQFPSGFLRPGIPMAEVLVEAVERCGLTQLETDEFGQRVTDPHELQKTGRWLYSRPDGGVVAVRRLPLADGGFLSISSDRTAHKKHEQELVAAWEQAVIANRSKSEFLANVSHELRTPLNAIIGFSEVLERELFGPIGSERYRSYIQDIRTSGEHLLSLINDILDLSKIEAGRFQLRPETIDCCELSQAVARLIRPRATENNQNFELNIPDRQVLLNADKRALKQVLINLLSNAVKFTPEGGSISLSCQPTRKGVEFVISDTGIGISEADLDLAMSPFGQIDSRYTRKYDGTGLGLPIVKGILDLHGGEMKIASVVGEGTRVSAYVPDQQLDDAQLVVPEEDTPVLQIAAS